MGTKIVITRAMNGVLIQKFDEKGIESYSKVETDPFQILANLSELLSISADIKAEWSEW